jgi:copper resistance protein B
MKRAFPLVRALACLLALASPAAFAQGADHSQHSTPTQHEGHDMANMPGMSAEEHARMMQAQSPAPTPAVLPPPTAEERTRAFPDLGGMDMRGHMDDDPFVATLALDRLEMFRDDGANALEWELHGWAGHRSDRFEWRTRGERVGGDTRDGEVELLWSHATGPWWNRTLGVRHDFGDGESRDWLALGVEGIAPYKIDVTATLYAGESGLGARAEASYDLLLTQRLVLQPRLEADSYAGNDAPRDSFEAGLRLRYEFGRQFAPYVGYAWSTSGGDDGENGGHWVAGIRGWF